MTYQYTLKDLELLRSHNKHVRVKATLLDDNYNEVENITGRVKSAPYDIAGDSAIRRTCSLTLSVPKKDQINLDFERTWIKRMVRLSCGISNRLASDDEFTWYPLGTMLMVDSNSLYNATTQEIKMSLVDLMAALTDSRGSQMGLGMKFPAGSSVRGALIAVVTEFSPYKRYNIPEFEDTIPYDIVIEAGRYPYDALKEILDLFPYYEMFYDNEGIFTVQKIPMKIEDPVDMGSSFLDDMLISESRSVKFTDIKNTTEIWGRSLDALYTALTCTSNGARYDLFIDSTFKELVVGETYSFVPDLVSAGGQSVKIQDTPEYMIYKESGTGAFTAIESGAMHAGIPYVIRFSGDKFVLQGELEIHVIVQTITEEPSQGVIDEFKRSNACRDVRWLVSPDCPFACVLEPTTKRIDREIRQVLQNGEYSNIYTTELAFERACYENWLKTRLQDVVEYEMLLIPWIDVNDKVEFTSPVSGEIGTFIVQNVSFDFRRWTMTVRMSRFYPYYPW